MKAYAARRAAWALGTVVLASIVTFTVFWAIPNVQPEFNLGGGVKGTNESRAAAREEWGLDEPLPVQYVDLMKSILDGSIRCFSACGDLRAEFFQRLPVTAWLTLGATLLAAALATSTALLCVRFHGRRLDRLLLAFAAVLHAVPTLVLTVVLWTILCQQLEIFPYEGYTPLTADPARWAWHLALPWVAVALPFAGAYTPVLRAAMLDARSADWVRTARAKGLKERVVVRRHMLRTTLATPVSILGLDLSHDLPAVVAMTVWLSITVVVVSAVIDIVVRALDPRLTADEP